MEEYKITYFQGLEKDLYRQTEHKVTKHVHTAKYQLSTERIALTSSSKEVHQVADALSNFTHGV